MPFDALPSEPTEDHLLVCLRVARQLLTTQWGKGGRVGLCTLQVIGVAAETLRLKHWDTFRLKCAALGHILPDVPTFHRQPWLVRKLRWPAALVEFNDSPWTTREDVLAMFDRAIARLHARTDSLVS